MEKVREQREPENRGWHTINTKERYPWGIQSADFSGGGDPILDSVLSSTRAIAYVYKG